MKKIMLVALLASSMFFNTACTDDEVAAGIIGVGVGVGIAAGAGDHDHYHRPPPRYPGPDYGHRPGYGPGYGRGPGWGGPGRPHRGFAADVTLATSSAFDTALASSNPQVVEFANKYNVSTDAATKIQSAFANVESQGIASFQAIGLNKADLKAISQRQLPEDSSLKALSEKLDVSQAQARDLVQSLIKDFDAQASDVSSTYWQSCMAKGSWKTPQNLYCTSTSWNGCAPATGATLCY